MNALKQKLLKTLLLLIVSLIFISCSNLFDNGDLSSSEQNEASGQTKTITITGSIKLPEELIGSGAIPEEYKGIFDSIERTAFPQVPAGTYYVTAKDENDNALASDKINLTTTATGASFSITLPIEETATIWTIEAGFNASFNDSTVTILKDSYDATISTTTPTFNHDFELKPLAIDENSVGNIDLDITYQTSGTAAELELYFGNDKITPNTANGESISPTKITLKNKAAGSYKAKLVFKKNGYVVYMDYQGINVFPNMTTNKWINNGGSCPITASNTYYVTDNHVRNFLVTQIYVGSTTVSGTTFSADDTDGNGTVFAPFATFGKAIDYLQKNGDTSKDYTIWISGEISGAQTISDGTTELPTTVKAKSLTISGVTGNTSDSLKGGSSGSVLLVDTSVSITITNLLITGGKGTNTAITSNLTEPSGGGLNIKKGTVTLDTGAQITGNHADYGGGVYVASGATFIMKGDSLVGDGITNSTTTATATSDCANYASYGGGIFSNGGSLYIGYLNTTTVDSDFSGGVNRNFCPNGGNTTTAWGAGIYYKGLTFKMSGGNVSYNYAYSDGGGLVISGENTNFYFTGGSVAKNHARLEAGGIYLKDKANIFMSGSAIIGDTGTSMTQTTDFSNRVTSDSGNGGGGIRIEGSAKLYLGYTDASHIADTFTGGICHNYSPKNGGGINNYYGQVYIAKGNISYNKSESSGGGVQLSDTINMTGGTFTGNICGTGNGGAINFSGGNFNFNGGVSFTSGSAKNNDIYISGILKITFAGTATTGSAVITPSEWTRGKQIFAAGSGVTITDDMLAQFSLTDSDWSIVKSGSGTSTIGKIDSPIIYVAGNNRNSSFGAPNDTSGEGTKTKPYESISKAASVCWTNETNYKIIVSGIITGVAQTIPSSVTSAKARTITIEGYENNTKDKINRNLSAAPSDSTSGTALTISTPVPVTIKNLTISGGYASGTSNDDKCGGGIKISAGAQVTLDTGTNIDNNYAQSDGGGVYLSGTNAKLTVNTGAMIGKTSTSTANSASSRSNYAGQHGGGICADNGANVIINGGTISYNFAGSYGGGLALKASQTSDSTATISGSPSITRCGGNNGGGALYISGYGSKNKNATVSMTGGTIDNCYASDSYSSIQLTTSGVLELGGSVSIPYSNSDTKNYIYMSCSGWSQNGSSVYGISSIKFISELSNHNSSNKIKVYVQGTEDSYKNLADITAESSGLLTSELPKIDINNSLTGYAQQLFAKDTTLDSTGKSAYYRHYRGTKLPTATKAVGDIMFNDGSATPYSNGLSLHIDQKAAAVAVIFKTASGKAYGVGLKQKQDAWADTEARALAFNTISDTYDLDDGKRCMQSIEASPAFRELTFPAMWWASNYQDDITNEGIYTSDWYLPARNELKAVYNNKSTIDSVITLLTSTYADSYITDGTGGSLYWSATNASDATNGLAWCVNFSNGNIDSLNVPAAISSVAIREF